METNLVGYLDVSDIDGDVNMIAVTVGSGDELHRQRLC
jgi:hypothetical protein